MHLVHDVWTSIRTRPNVRILVILEVLPVAPMIVLSYDLSVLCIAHCDLVLYLPVSTTKRDGAASGASHYDLVNTTVSFMNPWMFGMG